MMILSLLLLLSTFSSFVTKVLLYDLRSSRPLLVKDHFYNLPIKSLNFHNQLDLIVSADSKIIKIWNKDSVRKSNHPEKKNIYISSVCIYEIGSERKPLWKNFRVEIALPLLNILFNIKYIYLDMCNDLCK